MIRLCEGQLGITWREWRVLASLHSGGAMLSSALAEHTQLDRPRTSRSITSLAEKGLISRQGVAGDMRKATVCLTAKGHDLHATFFPVVAHINAQLVQTLSEDDLATVDRALTAMQQQAQALQWATDLPKANRRRGGQPTQVAAAIKTRKKP